MTRLLLAFLLPLFLVAAAPAQTPGELDTLQEKAAKEAVRRVAPCVVAIETSGGTEVVGTGPRGGPGMLKGIGPTTGLLVSADGYVISSAFNFANKPSDIFVTVPGKKRYVAKAVATDQTRMLTLLQLLQVAPGDLPMPIPMAAPKAEVKVGHTALALGRTLDPNMDRPPSVSGGIISAVNRIWGRAFQTDAKVSPTNYGGPLIDLQGRVLGVIVPSSPQSEGETAGAEWYDGGIGFAIPLADVIAALPRLKEGKDLRRGMLGVTMQGEDLFGSPPVIQSVSPDSAAARAGLKTGDKIVELDGHAITRQAQFRHAIGPKYEGDEVSLKVLRKDGNAEQTVTVAKLKLGGPVAAFAQPFLGILPLRDDPELGLEVRHVLPGTPAATAGLKAGDRIMKLGMGPAPVQPFSGREELAGLLALVPGGMDVKLEVKRKEGQKTETLTVKLGQMPEVVPGVDLPQPASAKRAREPRKTARPMGPGPGRPPMGPGRPPMPPMPEKKDDEKKGEKKEDKKPESGLLKRTGSGGARHYWLYVPEDHDPNISYALMIWLHPAGKSKDRDLEDFELAWEDVCRDQHVILAMPKSEAEAGWLASEADFIREVANEVTSQYTVDRRRVVVHGMGVGGQMAFYLGFQARDLVRGVATTGAVLANNPKDNVASQPLSFFVVTGEKDPIAKAVAQGRDKLTERKFPVAFREIKDLGHQYLDDKTLTEMARWLDALDAL